MHRLVSPFILERYAAGESSGQFEAATLFVDMSGFSAMTSKLMEHGQHGAEVLATVMRAIFDPLVEAVYAYGGFITVFAGDAFTAVFPAVGARHSTPIVVPTTEISGNASTLRALAAAWTMREHLRAHPSHGTPYGVFEIGVKVGLAAGEVDWGIIRSADETRAAFYFRGPAIDDCATAQSHAEKDDIVLHPSAYTLLADAVVGDTGATGREHLPDDHLRVTRLADTRPQPHPQPVELSTAAPEILSHFYPRAIIEQTQTGEFRQAINVFISLQGSPTAAQLAHVVENVFGLQAKYGGLLNRVDFGDKGCSLLLFWGAPVAHENDVTRALDFLLELHDRTHIPIRAGVTSRISHAGFIGSALHEEYTCYGMGVNLAARLMTSAPWEGIWLDEEVKLRVEHQFELADEGQRPFRGFSEPEAVYSLLGYRATGVLEFYNRKLVGRQAELARLAEFLKPLDEGRCAGILVVTGEPGIGKSRLVHEFLFEHSCLTSETCQVFIAQTDSVLRRSLNPLRYWLRDYFGVSAMQSEAYNKRAFGRKLALIEAATTDHALREELVDGRSFLGALVDLSWEDSAYARADAEARYESTLSALKALILAESLHRATILVVEDVHWLDEDSIQFIARLARATGAGSPRPYPLAILATARPEQEERLLSAGLGCETLALADLAADDLATLGREILGGPASPALLNLIMERSAGNPFFAEQIALYLRDGGLLERVDGAWVPSEAALRAAPLPANVRAIFIARLDRLAHEVREVVQTAAILGREFEINVLARMLRHEGLLSSVAEAESAAIWSALTELHYLFKHVLMRDAAYEMQVRARRAELHQLAGHALETVYAADPSAALRRERSGKRSGQDLAPHYGELAYHYEAAALSGMADAVERARTYLIRAGKQAADRYENAAAVDYYSRALALMPGTDLRGRFDLLLARSKVYDARGERDLERPDLAALEQLADKIDDDSLRLEAALRWANHDEETGQFQTGYEVAGQALALARSLGDIERQLHAMYMQGSLLYRLADFDRATVICEEGLVLARDHNLSLNEADLLTVLSFTLDAQGESVGALAVLQRALAVYQTANDRSGEMATLNSIAIAEYGLGRYADASAHFDDAIRLARETGRRKSEARYLGNVGQLQIALGDLSKAQNDLERALLLNREIANRDSEAINHGNLGVVATKRGDFDVAHDFFAQATAIAKEVDDKLLACETLAYWGLLDVHRGELDAAIQRCDEALVLVRELGSPMHEGLILMTQGHAHLAAGQPGQALTLYRAALDARSDMGLLGYVVEPRAGLARAHLALGQQAEAAAEGNIIAEHLALSDGAMGHGLIGAEDGLWVYLTCSQVLRAVGDARAEPLLRRAYDLLQAEAAQFEAGAERARYVESTAYRREIVAEYRRLTGEGAPAAGAAASASSAILPADVAVDVRSGQLAYAKLAGDTLSGLSLRGADLNHADLRRADLTNTDLRGADLSHADLRKADLGGADLRRADLSGADLRGADFTAADLRGADLADAIWDERTRWPAGFDPGLEA